MPPGRSFLLGKDDRLLTASQAAEELGLTYNALAIMRTRGGGPEFIKLPGNAKGTRRDTRRVRYSLNRLRQWAQSTGIQTRTELPATIKGSRS